MTKGIDDILIQFELHSPEGIDKILAGGLSPNEVIRDQPLIIHLIGMYTRTPRFAQCVQVLVNRGLEFHDQPLLAVLLNDKDQLLSFLESDPDLINHKVSLDCAYTPLLSASLLHICAEFNHLGCAEVLVAHGADVNMKAGTDEHGFGGQTPIFHTVNQNSNNSAEMMDFLLDHNADLEITVKGIVWGKSYPWETFIPSVNPVSYAMMGLLPQMHRDQQTTAQIVTKLLKRRYGIDYTEKNVPNKYLED